MSHTRSTADSAARRAHLSTKTCSGNGHRHMHTFSSTLCISNKPESFDRLPFSASAMQTPLAARVSLRANQRLSCTRRQARNGLMPRQALNFFLATPMSYSVSFATPSRSPGLLLDNDIHFASASFIFSSGSFVSVGEDILMLQRADRYVVATARRVHVVSSRVVCSLNRVATALAVKDSLIAIGSRQAVEVWKLHTTNANNEHVPPFFSLRGTFSGHSDSVTSILFLDGVGIVSTSLDCTTRLHACDADGLDVVVPERVGGRGARVISTHKSAPLKAFEVDECVAIVTRRGVVSYLDREWNAVCSVHVEGDVVSAAKCGSTVAVLARASDGKSSGGHTGTLRLVLVTRLEKKEIELDGDFCEIAANNNLIALKGDSVSIYNPSSGTLTKLLDLVDVTAMCEHRDRLAVGCTDHRLRLYSPFVCTAAAARAETRGDVAARLDALRQWLNPSKFYDENVREAPLGIHMADNLLLSLTLSGYVSVFNVSDTNCFRSFPLNTKVRTSAVSPDFSVLFVAGHRLCAVDVKRGRKVDEFDYQVLSIRCTRDKAYFLTLDALIVYDYSDFTSHAMRLESGTVCDEVSVVANNTVTMYDLGLNYVRSLSGSRVFCSNSRRIVVDNAGVEVVELDSMESERLDVEDPRDVACSCTSRRLYVLTAHTVLVYDSRVPFADLDLDATTQSFDTAFSGARFYEALVIAIKLGRADLLRRVMCASVFSVRSLGPKYVSAIKGAAVDMIESDTMAAMRWLRMSLFEHDGLELDDIEVHRVKTVLERVMAEGRRNWRMLSEIKKRALGTAKSAADAAAQ